MIEVDRDEGLIVGLQDAVERAVGRRLDRAVDVIHAHVAAGHEDQVDQGDVGRGDADRGAEDFSLAHFRPMAVCMCAFLKLTLPV